MVGESCRGLRKVKYFGCGIWHGVEGHLEGRRCEAACG
jgi:hypothetical protein